MEVDINVQAAEVLPANICTSIMEKFAKILFARIMVTMNIVEALKKNKPLRRPVSKHLGSAGCGWLAREYVFNLLICGQVKSLFVSDIALMQSPIEPIVIDKHDILADDWEVKE